MTAQSGMAQDRLGIPHAGVVHVERDAVLGGHLPPEPQRIADKARRRVADLGRIARQPGMALAVDLEVVGMDLVDDVLDHRAGGVLADLRAVRAGVEIEVDAQEAVGPLEPRRLRGKAGRGEGNYGKTGDIGPFHGCAFH